MAWCICLWESPCTDPVYSGHNKYLEAYDCKLRREILFRIYPHCLPSDNPQQAESSSGVGPGGNLNCVHGKAGGGKEERESDKGYLALFSVRSHHVFDMGQLNSVRSVRGRGETNGTRDRQNYYGANMDGLSGRGAICVGSANIHRGQG